MKNLPLGCEAGSWAKVSKRQKWVMLKEYRLFCIAAYIISVHLRIAFTRGASSCLTKAYSGLDVNHGRAMEETVFLGKRIEREAVHEAGQVVN
jgi:hypothetical protein